MNSLPPIRTGAARALRGHVQPVDGVEIPYGLIEGAQPGPCLLVTAGVHGSEFNSIEVALRLTRTAPERIKGVLLVLPVLNFQGFRKRSIYVMPEDGKNLNRMFPGKADGTVSERLAHWLVTSVYPQANAYLDLHGGDLSESLTPFAIYPGGSEPSKALAVAFGLPIVVASGARSVNHGVYAACNVGVPSVLAEVGGNGLWSEATVGRMMDGVERVMGHIGMIDRAVRPPEPPTPEYVTMWVPAAPLDGFWYPAKDLSEPVAEGEALGEIKDAFGAVLATIRSEKAGKILYRLTSLSVNKDEALLGVGTPVAG